MNPEASVAQLTEANCDLSADDVEAYAKVAERMFGQEIVYVEYSGMFGDTEKVAAAHDALDEAALFTAAGSTATSRPTRWPPTATLSSSATCSTTRASTRSVRR